MDNFSSKWTFLIRVRLKIHASTDWLYTFPVFQRTIAPSRGQIGLKKVQETYGNVHPNFFLVLLFVSNEVECAKDLRVSHILCTRSFINWQRWAHHGKVSLVYCSYWINLLACQKFRFKFSNSHLSVRCQQRSNASQFFGSF